MVLKLGPALLLLIGKNKEQQMSQVSKRPALQHAMQEKVKQKEMKSVIQRSKVVHSN